MDTKPKTREEALAYARKLQKMFEKGTGSFNFQGLNDAFSNGYDHMCKVIESLGGCPYCDADTHGGKGCE